MDTCQSSPCPSKKLKASCDFSNFAGNSHRKSMMAKKFRCRSKRLKNLARPKFVTPKFSSLGNAVESKSKVQIISEEQTPVRIKMLSFPKVRKLVATREEFDGIVDLEWTERFRNLIDQSKATLYSRLANVRPPVPVKRTSTMRKMTPEDWKKHKEWLAKRAEPKPVYTPKEEKPQRSIFMKNYRPKDTDEDFDLDSAMNRLSTPRNPRKKFEPECGYKSAVEASALLYNTSERIKKLAVKTTKTLPETEESSPADYDPFSVNPMALKSKPSKRIKELAKPKSQRRESIGPVVTPFGTLARSLKAHSSQRTLELAKPREKDDDDDEPRPAVNPKALKAKPSKRVLELAKPRVIAEV